MYLSISHCTILHDCKYNKNVACMGHYLLSSGCIENPRSSVIGLFRRESTSSTHMSSCESSPGGGHIAHAHPPLAEGFRSQSQPSERHHHHVTMHQSSLHGPSAVLLIEEGDADPLGVLQSNPSSNTVPRTTPTTSTFHTSMSLPRPTTARRGSMLELPTGSVSIHNDENEHISI